MPVVPPGPGVSTTKAVRYTQMILGTSAAGELVAVPGATVTIRRDGVATEVYASSTRSPLANPLPVGVADGQPGIDMQGNLTVYLDPDDNYDAVVTVGTASTTIVLPDISPDVEDVEAPIPPGTYAKPTSVRLVDYFPAHGGALDGSVGISAALQAAVDNLIASGTSHGQVVLPWGTLKWDAPVYHDSSVADAYIEVVGPGKGCLIKPSGFVSGDSMFVVNEARAGGAKVVQFPGDRAAMRGFQVDGVDSAGATLMHLREAHGELSSLELRRLLNGLKTEGYCDRVTLRRIDCASWRAGGWLYEQGNNGDGFIGEQLFFYLTPGLYLKRCAGGTIDGMIGGAHRFEDCQGLTVKNAHIEGHQHDALNLSSVEVIGSEMTISDSVFWSHTGIPASVEVDDSVGYRRKTDLTLERVRFVAPLGPTGYVYGQERGMDVYLTNFGDSSVLRWRDSVGETMIVGADSSPRWIFEQAGLKLGAADATLNTAITTRGSSVLATALSFGSWDLRRVRGTWAQNPPAPLGFLRSGRRITTHSLAATASTTAPVVNLPAATYYYWMQVINALGYASSTVSTAGTATNGTEGVRLNISATHAPVLLRLWRGTVSGTFDRYVDIPIGTENVELYDQGNTIAGYAWLTTGVPAQSFASNPTMDGFQVGYPGVTGDGRRQFWGTAIPTGGSFFRGDFVWNVDAAVGGIPGWVCTTTGAPGTWQPMAALGLVGLGFPSTVDLANMRSSDTLAIGIAGAAAYLRCEDGGTISKVGLTIGVSSGNICVAAYTNSGTGRAAAPTGGRLASSGAVACPAPGYQEISLGSTINMAPGDWLGISTDNATATVSSVLAGAADSNLGLGVQFRESSAHPLPTTPSALVATIGRSLVLVGAP